MKKELVSGYVSYRSRTLLCVKKVSEMAKDVLISKLQGYIPNFLKPILRPLYHTLYPLYFPFYYRLQKATVKHKTRDELHRFWRHPGDSSRNLPIDYLREGEERSQFLVDLIKGYVEPNAKILEIGCNVGRNLNYLFNAGYTKLGGGRD